MRSILFTAIAASIPLARAHIQICTQAMWGFDVHMETFPYDNRPMAPLQNYTFDQWWFHGHLDHPPEPGYFVKLPAGGDAHLELSCNLGGSSLWALSEGTTDMRQGNTPCPNSPSSAWHGLDDVKGCAISIAYTSDIESIKPEDLAVFTVNHTCVWELNTYFQVPKDMPPCPEGGCICAWHWIHSVDSGSAQMYMNGFRCKVTGSTSTKTIMKPEVPKRCTGDLSKCNQGAQQPLYWFQAEGNNTFNGQYDPPYYLDEWGFTDGPQNNILEPPTSTPTDKPPSTPSESYPSSTPPGSDPSSTPVDNKPTPTPETSPIESPPTGCSGGNLPKPSSSSQGDGEGNTKTSTMDPHHPTPSETQQCKDRKGKKRSDLASRHFKHKRHHAREHNH